MVIDEFERIRGRLGFDEGIHGKEEYFNSVVLVLLVPINGEYHFVLQKRCTNIRQGGEICFPGGKVDENDKTLEEVAIRETTEEMGIPKEKIIIIGRLNTIVAPMGATVEAFIGIAKIGIEEICINQTEVESVFSIPVSYFMKVEHERYSVQIKIHPSYTDKETGEEIILLPSEQLGLPDMYKKPWGSFKYGVLVYKTDYGIIWGITSRLIYDFISKINNLSSVDLCLSE